MSIVFVAQVNLITVECCNCHVVFAMPKEWNDHFRKTHQSFYCPAGHGQSYGGESDIEKAKREELRLKREELRLQSLLNIERHARTVAEKAQQKAELQKRRLEKRIAAGVCPCCNRTFGNLAHHMETQHKGELGSGKDPKMIAGPVQ